MKVLKFLSATALTTLLFLSCSKERIRGSGETETTDRNVNNFTKIFSAGATDVVITRGTTFSVQVRGYANLLPHYETVVRNGVLQLGFKGGSNISNDNTEVFITMPELERVELSGSGNLESSGLFTGARLDLVTSGSGNIRINDGDYDMIDARISGSGNIRAFGVAALQAITHISGSGDIEVSVADHLDATIRGSGNVYYRGDPTTEADISGSGRVIKQ